ncbi:MAG: thioredoxin family protein [Prosthecobacter sp.]|jgi:thiol:disulfide interchange protein|uniref:protein-disulfide reductase DsbD family protein n=1 Tax=Prosthecobacter sp. TaxID=1965333 RepID=UPI001A015A9A|nr:thioredoxin family protein [Prosthecobacter sp.]MBE2282503.1 thioredoxin family protein [Prosthecobacter sp.]
MIARRLLATLALLVTFAQGQSIDLPGLDDKPKQNVTASLVAEVSAAAPGTPFRAAVKLVHVPGAHTYGNVLPPEIIGKPTKVTWELPDGWTSQELPWPAVHPFKSLDGTPSEGYEGTVYIPAQITPPATATAGAKAEVKAKIDGLVCDDKSCMPFKQEAAVTLNIATQPVIDAELSPVFATLPSLPKANATDTTTPVSVEAPPTFLFIMFSAFIGGLILNVMPCVFPVLGIKVVSIVKQAGEDRKQVVMHGLIYTLGILLSFWALGGLVVALGKGWGFQLQSAGFNFGLAAFFLIFGLNMAGVFEIGASAVGVGQDLQAKHGFSGSFFSGLLATLVSTPCSAPFLGTALGFAVKLPAPQAMLLFTLIGLGLASPFLLLSAFPKLVSVLPRPGAWMESFKQGMSFLLFGTVAFMLWVLTGMIEGLPLLILMLGLVLVALGCWIYGRWSLPHKPARTRTISVILALIAIVSGLYLGWPHVDKQTSSSAHGAKFENGLLWEPWSEAKVAELIAAGKPVYIDFTAKWCWTCQVNKRVYPDAKLQELFKKHGVVTVKADYTNEDEAIKKAFTALGRGAVPVNVLYIPGEKPHVLPEILTVDNVAEALNKIGQ